MKFIALFLVVSGLSCFAHADETYFDTLKKTYIAAHDQIGPADFDEIGASKAKTCVAVYALYPEQQIPVYMRKFTLNTPGNGPLLPPKTFTKVIYTQNSDTNLQGAAGNVTTVFTAAQVHSIGVSNLNFEIYVRKSGDYTVFAVTNGSKTPEAYGYCY
jgi:hypothetical protein